MPRGAPDYSNVRVGKPLHRLDDMAELAARLGSPNVYDRSGNMIWATDFENGLQGTEIGTDHDDSTGGLSAERAFHGDFSVKLDPRGATDAFVNWGRVIHYLDAGPVGVEFALSFNANIESFRAQLFYFRPDDTLQSALLYESEGHVWKIQTGKTEWVTVFSDLALQAGGGSWTPIKMVVDFETGKYVRVQVGKNIEKVTDYDIYVREYLGAGQVFVKLQCNGSAAKHEASWIDGVIITQNEP